LCVKPKEIVIFDTKLYRIFNSSPEISTVSSFRRKIITAFSSFIVNKIFQLI